MNLCFESSSKPSENNLEQRNVFLTQKLPVPSSKCRQISATYSITIHWSKMDGDSNAISTALFLCP